MCVLYIYIIYIYTCLQTYKHVVVVVVVVLVVLVGVCVRACVRVCVRVYLYSSVFRLTPFCEMPRSVIEGKVELSLMT